MLDCMVGTDGIGINLWIVRMHSYPENEPLIAALT